MKAIRRFSNEAVVESDYPPAEVLRLIKENIESNPPQHTRKNKNIQFAGTVRDSSFNIRLASGEGGTVKGKVVAKVGGTGSVISLLFPLQWFSFSPLVALLLWWTYTGAYDAPLFRVLYFLMIAAFILLTLKGCNKDLLGSKSFAKSFYALLRQDTSLEKFTAQNKKLGTSLLGGQEIFYSKQTPQQVLAAVKAGEGNWTIAANTFYDSTDAFIPTYNGAVFTDENGSKILFYTCFPSSVIWLMFFGIAFILALSGSRTFNPIVSYLLLFTISGGLLLTHRYYLAHKKKRLALLKNLLSAE